MPKLKTKSSAKKRFKFTAKGKIKMPQSGKRHGMIKRTNSQIRKQRGTTIMSKQDTKIVKSYMPYSLRGQHGKSKTWSNKSRKTQKGFKTSKRSVRQKKKYNSCC